MNTNDFSTRRVAESATPTHRDAINRVSTTTNAASHRMGKACLAHTIKCATAIIAICTFLMMLPLSVAAQTPQTAGQTATTINNWYGVSGITASANNNVVTVTEAATISEGSPLNLSLASNVTVKWQANITASSYTSHLINFDENSAGSFELSGSISFLSEGNGTYAALYSEGATAIIVNGGGIQVTDNYAIALITSDGNGLVKVTGNSTVSNASSSNPTIWTDNIVVEGQATVSSTTSGVMAIYAESDAVISGGAVSNVGSGSGSGSGSGFAALVVGGALTMTGGAVSNTGIGNAIQIGISRYNPSTISLMTGGTVSAISGNRFSINPTDNILIEKTGSGVSFEEGTSGGLAVHYNALEPPATVEWALQDSTGGIRYRTGLGITGFIAIPGVTVTLAPADIIPPVPGSSGTITIYPSTNSLTLSWTKATDNKTAQSALKYYVYRSDSNNINTVADCETNGTPINANGTVNIAQLIVSGLTEGLTYYFNVVVKDTAGNKAAYTMKQQATSTNRSVSVSAQTGTLNDSIPGSVTYTLTTTNINSGAPITLNNINSVAGVTLETTILPSGTSKVITISTTSATPEGSHPLSLTLSGSTGGGGFSITSANFYLVVDPAVPAYTTTINIPAVGGNVPANAVSNPGVAAQGSTVHLPAVTANAGFAFNTWQVTAGGITVINPTSATGASFVMGSQNVAINAVFVSDVTAPGLSTGTVKRTNDTQATIGFTTDEAGTAYYLVQNSGVTAPANGNAVKTGGTSIGSVSPGAVSGKAVTLSAGAQDIYVVVEDAASNISSPLKIEAAAYNPTANFYVSGNGITYATLAAAVAVVQTGWTITMLQDVTITNTPVILSASKTYTLDLGRNTLSGNTGALLVITAGTVTIQNQNDGSVVNTNSAGKAIVVNGGTVYILSGNYTGGNDAIYLQSGSATITSGHFKSTHDFFDDGCLVEDGSLTIGLAQNSSANPSSWSSATEVWVTAPDNTAPTISSVTPNGANAATFGNIIITFSEAMDTTQGMGTVQLNSLSALTGGLWSGGNTVFAIPYRELTGGTSYTVNISGFKDAASNTMTTNSAHSFTTSNVPIGITAIPGVTVPVYGATPVTTITATAEYTGTVTWNGNPVTFAAGTQYTATITLTPKTGYTLTGVAANFFTVSGATSVSNGVNSGVITAVFPATNKAPVSNSGNMETVTYAGTTIDLSALTTLFTIDANAGTPTYSIETTGNPTGTGSIAGDNKTLTVTKAGTFTIGLVTAATGTHDAGATVTATLTVNKGTQAAPTGIDKIDVTTYGGNDGKIIGLVASTDYEYSKDGGGYVSATSNTSGEITGLVAGSYVLRLAGNDLYNPSADAAAVVIEQPAAPDVTAPILSAGTANRTGNTQASIGFTTDEAGMAYYLVQNSDDAAPTSAEVKSSGISIGAVSTGIVSDKAVTLTAGEKYIYVIVEDTAGNISIPLKIEAPAFTGVESIELQPFLVITTANGFHITGLIPCETLSIYNILGQLLHKSKVNTTEEYVSLPVRGVYIVVSGKRTVKAVY